MGKFKIAIKPLSEEYLLISWPSKISLEISEELLAFEHFILIEFEKFILNTNPAYASLCIRIDIEKTTLLNLKNLLLEAYRDFRFNRVETKKYWEIPVCYDPSLGPDLLDACKRTSLALENFIALHSAPLYRIYFIGFLPGFLYLGGLDESLSIPRKKSPRPKVPAGSIGIAGNQTGIYPQSSPGGWQLIGQTKVSLFNTNENPPTPFKAGDYLKFTNISKEEFQTTSNFPILKSMEDDG